MLYNFMQITDTTGFFQIKCKREKPVSGLGGWVTSDKQIMMQGMYDVKYDVKITHVRQHKPWLSNAGWVMVGSVFSKIHLIN